MVFPGVYRCICVKLDIAHLAVTAVEQATLLNELEGGSATDVAADCAPAFRVLKNLVHKWLQDASSFDNRFHSKSSVWLQITMKRHSNVEGVV